MTAADWLLESEALAVAERLGMRAPCRFIVGRASEVAGSAVDALGCERVVVKAMARGLIHKSQLGAVRVVVADADSVRSAIVAIAAARAGERPSGYLVEEYVQHDLGPGGEWLVGIRHTDEFGPVVSFGPGGTRAEFLAGMAPEAVTICSAATGIPEDAVATSPFAQLLIEAERVALGEVLGRLAEYALDNVPDRVAEFEVNPVVFTDAGPVALDAVLRVGSPAPEPIPERPLAKLHRLLEPQTIAVIGVSQRMNVGRMILRNVIHAGFPPDRVTVVKPGIERLDGCDCVPDLASLAPVDLLVVCVDAAQVPEVMDEVIRLRCAESVVLIPGGLGERAGTEPAAEHVRAAIAAARRHDGPVVNGGNSLGVRSRPGRFDTFFIPDHKLSPSAGREEPVAVISQSGALVLSRLDRLPWLTPRFVVSVGNQIDVTVGDYLTYFADDPGVEVAACYVEGFRPGDGSRFLAAAHRLRQRGGAVVLYCAGRTREGAGAAASHTAAIAGDYAVTRALAAAAGVLVADTLADFADLLMLAVLLRDKRVDGLALGAASNAGFETVAIADRLRSLTPADLDPATVARIDALLEAAHLDTLVAARNPLDLTPVADDATFAAAAQAVLDAPTVDVGLIGCVPFTAALATLAAGPGHDEDVAAAGSVATRLGEIKSPKAWAAVVDGGAAYGPMARLLTERGIPTFREADRAVAALDRYCEWRRGR